MELIPSTVPLMFNPWPLNIYQLLNSLCTIIPSSISQIYHFDHSSQFQVKCTIGTDVLVFTLQVEMRPGCSTVSSTRQSQSTYCSVPMVQEQDRLPVKSHSDNGDKQEAGHMAAAAFWALGSPSCLYGSLKKKKKLQLTIQKGAFMSNFPWIFGSMTWVWLRKCICLNLSEFS